MKLFILGATGRTGHHILDLARHRGHEALAFVRSPQKLAASERLSICAGDPRDTARLAEAMRGSDAVLSVLGPPPREAFRPHTLLTDCAASTVAAMTTSGVSRLGILSAALLFPDDGLRFRFFRWLLGHHVSDLSTMEAIVTASRLAWTIARPPRLVTKGDATYVARDGAMPEDRFTASFRAVAAFMLDAIEQRTHIQQIVGVAQ